MSDISKPTQEKNLEMQTHINVHTTDQTQILNSQLQELREENVILFSQVSQAQEELEKFYYRLRDSESKHCNTQENTPSTFSLQAENNKLSMLVQTYKSLRTAEMSNTITSRIGMSILQLKKSIWLAPIKLFTTLYFFTKTTPPKDLGGKEFTTVLSLYESNGIHAVKKLIKNTKTTSIIKANAYTAVAKKIQHENKYDCVAFAKEAYMTDPRDTRLKWWILRLESVGDIAQAQALLELLPAKTPMNNSEKKIIERIRKSTI